MSHLCCLFPVGAVSVGELSSYVICEAWEPEGSGQRGTRAVTEIFPKLQSHAAIKAMEQTSV